MIFLCVERGCSFVAFQEMLISRSTNDDERVFKDVNEWVPIVQNLGKGRFNFFTDKCSRDVQTDCLRYLSNKDRISLSLVDGWCYDLGGIINCAASL